MGVTVGLPVFKTHKLSKIAPIYLQKNYNEYF